MNTEDRVFHIDELLSEGNYLAACLHLKDAEVGSDSRNDLTGRIAKRVIEDLASERNKEKITFLRSVLVWLFKDIPGLSSVYREQLRVSSGVPNPLDDLFGGLKVLRGLSNLGRGGASTAAEDIKDNIDEAAERVRDGSAQEQFNEFLSRAGENVEEGIRKAADFFNSLGGNPPSSGSATSADTSAGESADNSSSGDSADE